MVVNKRERLMAIGVGAALVLWILDSFIISPYFERSKSIASGLASAISKEHDDNDTLDRRRRLMKVWQEMQKGGLTQNDSQAESQALHAIVDYNKYAGVEISLLKQDRATEEGKFDVIGIGMTGNGSMQSLSRLLWAMETATIPVRINDLEIRARKEGADDLNINLTVSTLCMPPAAAAAPGGKR